MTKMIVTELLSLFEKQRSFILAVENLNNKQINWVPKGSSNSIGKLLDHMIGSEKFLIHQVIFGVDIKRDRNKEFEDEERSLNDLLDKYKAVSEESKRLLMQLNDENLLEERTFRDDKRTVIWALTHAIEHNYYHIGQINLLLALVKMI